MENLPTYLERVIEGNSISNPMSTATLIDILSRRTGISVTKTIQVQKFEDLRTTGNKPKLKYKSWAITVIDKSRNRHHYFFNGKRFDQDGIEAESFEVALVRQVDEFGPVKNTGATAKVCDGGGWYCNEPVFIIDGLYFHT